MLNSEYKACLYLRLSREDEDNEIESESIKNQRDFLYEYARSNNFNVIDEYVDDGYTGTNFDRPKFNQMIFDIKKGKINCVITKDMSRLGRDYIEVGNYLEKYFPENRIRYIAVNDGIDTIDGKIDDITPFKAIINDYYAKDISKKVRTALVTMKKKGEFLGGTAPYGYKFKSEDNHKELIVDEETALVVRRMFNMYASGCSLSKIAGTFNNEKIPIPSVHKKLNRGLKSIAYGLWQTRTIDEILKNPTYIGNLTQGRREKVNYKSKKIVRVPREKWIVVENTHEAIIDKDTFNKVQNIYEKNKNKINNKNNLLLMGFIYCKECKHTIGINKSKSNKYYCSCNFYKKYSKERVCTPHSNVYGELEKEILNEIRKECILSVDEKEIINVLKYESNKLNDNLYKIIKLKEIELNKNKNAIQELYIDKLKKEIDINTYNNIYNKLISECNKIVDDLKKLKNEFNLSKKKKINYEKIVKEYLKFKNPKREMLANIIDKIYIDENKNIDIHYKIRKTVI